MFRFHESFHLLTKVSGGTIRASAKDSAFYMALCVLCVQVFRGSVGEVVYCSARRCLCYPLYRHWQLVQCVLQDTANLFLLGIAHTHTHDKYTLCSV